MRGLAGSEWGSFHPILQTMHIVQQLQEDGGGLGGTVDNDADCWWGKGGANGKVAPAFSKFDRQCSLCGDSGLMVGEKSLESQLGETMILQ